jgi:hypothetical protein
MKIIKMVQDIPKQVNVFMKIDKHCAAFYINSPPLNVETKDIPTNCDMIEKASDLSDSMKIGVSRRLTLQLEMSSGPNTLTSPLGRTGDRSSRSRVVWRV